MVGILFFLTANKQKYDQAVLIGCLALLRRMGIEHSPGARCRLDGEVTGQAKIHARGLAMFDAAWPFTVSLAAHAEITQIGEKRYTIDLYLAAGQFVFVLSYFDTVKADRIIMFLLAGNFTRVTAGTEVRVN